MKIKSYHIFQILLTLAISVSLKDLLLRMLCVIGFDGVLGYLMGVVFSVVFGVLSTLVNFTLDATVGMMTFVAVTDIWFFRFSQDSSALLQHHLV